MRRRPAAARRMLPLLAALLVAASAAEAAAQGAALHSSGWRIARPASLSWPLAPGFYQLEATHSGRCLVVAGTTPEVPLGGSRVPHLAQRDCVPGGPTRAPSLGQVQLVPAPGGTYALLPHGGSGCATVARGVVLGAAAIDVHPCDPFNPAPDQRFTLVYHRQAEDGPTVELRTADGQCWDVRESSRAVGAEVIRWRCTREPNQVFRLRFGSVPSHPRAVAAAEAAGWFVQPEPPGLVAVFETPGVDLPGWDIASLHVDDFAGCIRPCLADGRCRAVSFTPPGVQHPTRGTCWLKDRVPAAVANPQVSSAQVRR